MGLSYSKNALLTTNAVMVVISTTSIALRFWSRAVVHSWRFGMDDWLALSSLPFVLALETFGIFLCLHGLGGHADDLLPSQQSKVLMLFYIGAVFFDIGLTLAKLSTLALYVSIFGFRRYPHRAWRVCFVFTTVATVMFPVIGVPLFIFVCNPVEKLWEPELLGHCLWQIPNQLPWAIYNVAVDFIILLLPMPALFRLNLRTSKKFLIAATLVVGYGVPFMSIGRLIVLSEVHRDLATDFSYAIVPLCFWLSVEPALGVFAICLPALFQLAKRWWHYGTTSLFSSRDFDNIARARAYSLESRVDTYRSRHSQLLASLRDDGGDIAKGFSTYELQSTRDHYNTDVELRGQTSIIYIPSDANPIRTKARTRWEP